MTAHLRHRGPRQRRESRRWAKFESGPWFSSCPRINWNAMKSWWRVPFSLLDDDFVRGDLGCEVREFWSPLISNILGGLWTRLCTCLLWWVPKSKHCRRGEAHTVEKLDVNMHGCFKYRWKGSDYVMYTSDEAPRNNLALPNGKKYSGLMIFVGSYVICL